MTISCFYFQDNSWKYGAEGGLWEFKDLATESDQLIVKETQAVKQSQINKFHKRPLETDMEPLESTNGALVSCCSNIFSYKTSRIQEKLYKHFTNMVGTGTVPAVGTVP